MPAADESRVADQLGRAAVLRRVELQIVRRLDGRAAGDHHTAAPGPGSERAGAREYQPGDDARRIDWNLTARSHQAHVRTTDADRELQTWLVVDRSASMAVGTADAEKREVALGAAAAFAILTGRAGNRLGLSVCGGERPVTRAAATGRKAMLAALATITESPQRDAPPGEGAGLAAALVGVRRLQPRRGLVVVISDFLDGDDWATPLRRLALHHQVVAVHVSDPRELELPAVGLLSVVDPETGRLVHVRTGSAKIRRRYAAAAADRMAAITTAIAGSGAACLELSTQGDWLSRVVTFAARRDRVGTRLPHPVPVLRGVSR